MTYIKKYIKKIAIIGNGGFSKEISYGFSKNKFEFFVHRKYIEKNDFKTKALEDLDIGKYKILLAIGDPVIRKNIVDIIPKEAEYLTYIDKHAIILDKNAIEIGKGTVICAGAVLTSNIKIGDFCQININSTIGHDCNIGNFFTCSPGVNISGNCNIGNLNYYGTNTALKNNINIVDNVTIGMNSNVIKNIMEQGVYVGNPLRKIK